MAPCEVKDINGSYNGNGTHSPDTINGTHETNGNHIDAKQKANNLENQPAWVKERAGMSDAFPSYYNDPEDGFRSSVNDAIGKIENLRRPTTDSPAHFGKPTPFWEETNDLRTEFPEEGMNMEDVISEVVGLFNGVNMVAHPNFQYNIVSHPNKAAIIATIIANYVSTNFTMGFSGWNTTRAEVEVGNMIASLIQGWTPGNQGGLFTYGGSGCYLYAMKYAISDVLKEHNPRRNGVGSKGRVITSRHGHFCNNITSDWLGIGIDSVTLVDTQPRTNKMCMIDLERKLKEAQEAGEPVFVVVCTMGTTDSMVMDPVDEVRSLIDKYPNPEGYGRPHIYCDSVAGWAFLTFKNYNFEENKLQFSPNVAKLLQRNMEEMSMIEYADSMALDFHKSGYSPVTTSMFVARDGKNFKSLLSRAPGHILHHRTEYSPGAYSVEVSRSCAPALSAWATFRFFGLRGFQTLIGGVVEMTLYLRELVKEEPDLVCTADIGCGYLTTLRAYPPGVDAKAQWEKEYTEDSDEARADIEKYNAFQKRIGDRIWELSRAGKKVNGQQAYLLNYSTNFCSTLYKNPDGSDGPSFYALKAFPMGAHITKENMEGVVASIKTIRDQVLAEDGDL